MDHTPGRRLWDNMRHARIYYAGKKGWSPEKYEAKAAEMRRRYAAPHRAYFVDYCRVHRIALASQDDASAGHVEEAHRGGTAIAEFPTTRLGADAARRLRLATVIGGPNIVRGGSHSGNLAACELARHALLDILCSDYVPGSLLNAVFVLHHAHSVALPDGFTMATRAPATALGLHDPDRVAEGLRADLIRVRPLAMSDGSVRPVVRAVWREGRRVS